MSQTHRTLVSLVALLVVASGVGLYAWKGVYEADKTTSEKKAHDDQLFAITKLGERAADGGEAQAEFVKLSVASQGETTLLERKPGSPWRIVAPISAKADKLVVDALVSQLGTSKVKDALDEMPDQSTLDRYGLTHPTFVVEVTAEVGEGREPRTTKIEGGIENSFDGTTYVRRNGERAVSTVQGGVRYALAKTTFDLRDKQILSVDEGQLAAIAVKTKVNAWSLERNADGRWAFVKPFVDLADPSQVSSMLSSQSSERAQSFPAHVGELKKVFDAPVLDATFTAKDGQSTRIRIAHPAGDAGGRWYGLREDAEGTLFGELNESAAHHLDRNPADLKDKTLVRFPKELVTRIVLSRAGASLTLERDSVDASVETWRVTSPRAGKAKVFKVASLLWALGGLKASAWSDTKPKDWAKAGIDGKARSIELYGPAGTELGRLTIGDELKDKKGTFFVRGQKDQLAECDGSRFSDFPFEVSAVLDEPVDAGQPDGGFGPF